MATKRFIVFVSWRVVLRNRTHAPKDRPGGAGTNGAQWRQANDSSKWNAGVAGWAKKTQRPEDQSAPTPDLWMGGSVANQSGIPNIRRKSAVPQTAEEEVGGGGAGGPTKARKEFASGAKYVYR